MTRLPCADLGLERDYLAGIVHDPEAVDRGRMVSPLDMASHEHGELLELVVAMLVAGKPLSPLSVAREAQERGAFTGAVGQDFLVRTIGDPGRISVTHAATRLREIAWCRRAREHAMKLAAACEELQSGAARSLAREAAGLADGAVAGERFPTRTLAELSQTALEGLHDPEKRDRIRFGIPALDDDIGGVTPGSLTVIGGRTHAGKSQLALKIAIGAFAAGKVPGIVSIEDTDDVIGSRAIAHVTGVDITKQFKTGLTHDDMDKLDRLLHRTKNLKVPVKVSPGVEPEDVCEMMERLVREDGTKLLIIDYIQACRFAKAERHDREVADAMKQWKGLAYRLRVPLITLSQLSRAPKDKPFKEPHNGDLKETGDLENEAEVIMLLWKGDDDPTSSTFGKISKLKWGTAGRRFVLEQEAGGIVADVKTIGGKASAPSRTTTHAHRGNHWDDEAAQ
jgi:replicative DNA helicase